MCVGIWVALCTLLEIQQIGASWSSNYMMEESTVQSEESSVVDCHQCQYYRSPMGTELNMVCRNPRNLVIETRHNCTTQCYSFLGLDPRGHQLLIRDCWEDFSDLTQVTGSCPDNLSWSDPVNYTIDSIHYTGSGHCCDHKDYCNTGTTNTLKYSSLAYMIISLIAIVLQRIQCHMNLT